MKYFAFLLLSIVAILFMSCDHDKADSLREHLQSDYTLSVKSEKLSSGSKAQYIQLEESINQTYVRQLDSLITTGFDRQLENFEDKELGVISGYQNMFSWLFKSKQSWEEELNLKSAVYFDPLDLEQEQNKLYLQYISKIKNLRQQFVKQQQLPDFTQFDLPQEDISLEAFSNHSRNNIGIEVIGELLGTKLFSWFLGFVITWILVTLLGLPAGPPGWLISLISFIIVIVVSAIMSYRNDAELIAQLKEQHNEISIPETNNLLKELNHNTISFYEKL